MNVWRRVLSFTVLNMLLVPVNVLVGWILYRYGSMHYLLAALSGYALQVILGFFLQRRLIFNQRHTPAFEGLLRAVLVECVSVCVMLATTWLFVEYLVFGYIAGRSFSMLCVGVWDYCAHAYITFRTSPFKNRPHA